MKVMICISLLACIAACNSETQQKGLNDIARIYGGHVQLTKGMSASTSESSGNYYEIELTNPDMFAEKADRIGIAGGIAYTLYKNLSEEEKPGYSKYVVTIKSGSGRQEEFTYSLNDVSLFYRQEQKSNEYMKKLLDGDFQYIQSRLNPNMNLSVDSVQSIFSPLVVEAAGYSSIEAYRIKAQTYTLDSIKIKIMTIDGAIHKDQKKITYTTIVDTLPVSTDILSLRYQY